MTVNGLLSDAFQMNNNSSTSESVIISVYYTDA